MSELDAEREWAGKLSGMAFILENVLASGFGNIPALQVAEREALRQWNNGALTVPAGLSRLDAPHVHKAGEAQIKAIFAGAIERVKSATQKA